MTEQTATIDASPFPPPTPPPPAPRRWYEQPVSRDPSDHKLGGVISGLSRTYGFDVRSTRIAVAIATMVMPVIAIAYGVAWALLPKGEALAVSFEQIVRDRRRVPLYIAIGLVLVAGGLGSFGSWFFLGGLPWGFGLIALGVLLWAAPGLLRAESGDLSGSAAWSPTRPLQNDDLRTRPRRRRRPVGSAVALGVLAFIGIAAAGDAGNWWDIPVLTVLVVSMVGVAAGALLSSIVNRTWAGVVLTVMMAPVVIGTLITVPDLDGGVGDRTVVPHTVADAETSRQLGVGELTLDLTELTGEQLAQGVDIAAEVGVGHLIVIVPDDATVVLDTEMGAGDVMLDGFNVSHGVRTSDLQTISPIDPSVGTIDLDLHVGIGRIDVHTSI